jgi:hypothetical protein
MSLAIDVDIIEKVLLADGWHEVADASFQVDTYEYVHGGRAVLSAGQVEGLTSSGAQWREPSGTIVACPITAILAVMWNTRGEL